MKTYLLAAGLLLGGLSLDACAPARLTLSRVYLGGEGAFDAAVVSVDTAVKTGALTGEAKTRAVALVDRGLAYIRAMRVARTVGNTADVAANTAALTTLVGQIETLIGKGAK